MEKKEKWTFEGESFEESLLIFGRMLADEVRRSGLRAYLPRGYILVVTGDGLADNYDVVLATCHDQCLLIPTAWRSP